MKCADRRHSAPRLRRDVREFDSGVYLQPGMEAISVLRSQLRGSCHKEHAFAAAAVVVVIVVVVVVVV